jgi:hypothetical protein
MKVTPSALVNSLSGKTGGIVAGVWKGVQYVRRYVIPANPKSAAQVLVRNAMAMMPGMYRSLIASVKAWNKTYGSKVAMTAFNVMTKYSRKAYQAGTAMQFSPPNSKVPVLITFAAATGAGAAGTIAITWASSVVTGFTKVVCMAIKHTAGQVYESATDTVLESVHSITLAALTPGTSYDCYAALYNPTTGEIGTVAMANATAHA